MKISKAIRMFGGALTVLASLNFAYAQSSDAIATADTAATSNAKSIRASNRALQRSVRRALSKIKGLSIANVTVQARGGAVTLAGSVPEQSQIDLVTQTAQGVAGVTSVKNAVTIRPVGH